MVSQMHNLLIVQWLTVQPLAGWWFLKKAIWVSMKPKHEKKCSSHADVVG